MKVVSETITGRDFQMSRTVINSVGLEAEVLLRDKAGELAYPAQHGLPRDNFPIICEVRGQPGLTREETVGNFVKEYLRVQYLAKKQGLTFDTANGWVSVAPQKYNEYVRGGNGKTIAACQNIYGTDLMGYTDTVSEAGVLKSCKISIGLHVHFSSVNQCRHVATKQLYDPVTLPLSVEGAAINLSLFSLKGEERLPVVAESNRITKPVIRHVVEQMDQKLHPRFKIEEPLRYRLPGFYEVKDDGRFEYRSLPFNDAVYEALPEITDTAYALLEDL